MKNRITHQIIRPEGIWTVYESGLQILKPYLLDEDGNEYASLDPNNELFSLFKVSNRINEINRRRTTYG
jgi:hypothetical protein